MAERRPKQSRVTTKRVTLGPGLHAGVVELASGARFRVRTLGGVALQAEVRPGVDRGLVDDCLRSGGMVAVADGARGAEIVGALQTRRAPSVSEAGVFAVSAKTIALRAEQTIELEAGNTALALERLGVVKMRGDKAVLDFNALVRVLSARVELP